MSRWRRWLAWQLAFIRARLDPDSYLGLQLTVGAAVLIGAGWLFGGVAEDVLTAAPLVRLDAELAQWLHRHASPAVTRFMLSVSSLHGTVAIVSLASLIGVGLARKRAWYWLATLVAAVPGGMLVNVMMKLAFHRARPSFDDPIVTLTSYSFPSGHVAGATLFYGFLLALLASRTSSWLARCALGVLALAMISLVALSRMYLGAHYLSDVLAAFAEGVAWLTLCVVGFHTYSRHRAQARALLAGLAAGAARQQD
jgi:membrane-associated phospholipid phosphatase